MFLFGKKKNIVPETAFPPLAPILYFRLGATLTGSVPLRYFANRYYTAVLARGTTPIPIKINQPFDVPEFVLYFYYTVTKMVQNENFITIFGVIRYDKKRTEKELKLFYKGKNIFTRTTYQFVKCKDAKEICIYDTVEAYKDTKSLDAIDLNHNYAFLAMRQDKYVFYLLVANYVVLDTDYKYVIYGERR